MSSMLSSFGRPGTLSNIKRTLKTDPLSDKVLQGKASMETMQRRLGAGVYLFPSSSGLAALGIRAVLIMKITCKKKSQLVSLALNPDACFSSFLISVLCGIYFYQKRNFVYIKKKKLFRQISFLQ